MGENTRLEDITLLLTSAEHHTLKGIVFGGTTSRTAKLRTSVLTVNNSTASSGGTSNVTGVECNGTGTLGPDSFSYNSLKGSTINVFSNGAGKKRGILVSNSNIITTRDLNVYVGQPTDAVSTGSYVGVETDDATSSAGSIQLRNTTVGTVRPTAEYNYTASDILQTTPVTILDPTYLATAGIQIGPGTDLVTKSAGGKGFSTYVYPNVIYYGLKGTLVDGDQGYLWAGTQPVTKNKFPDPDLIPAFFRVQQPTIISGLSCSVNQAPGLGHSITLSIRYTPVSGTIQSTAFSVTISGTDTVGTFYNSSVSLNTGDRIHLFLNYTDNNVAHDITAQIDLF